MRLLITGASGFIGRSVAASASRIAGCEVFRSSRSGVDVDGYSSIACDLLRPGEPTALIRSVAPTHLIHLAWNATPGKFWTAPDNLSWCTASGELLFAFASNGGRRAVLAGSCAEYDWSGAGLLSENRTPLNPATFYGVAKDSLRRLSLSSAGPLGLSIAWARVFWLFGPGEPRGRLVSETARALVEGRTAPTSHGMQMRDFLHVDDVGAAFVVALLSGYEGAFNIGSGVAVKVRDVVTALANNLGSESLLRIGALSSPVDDPQCLVADTTILCNEVGFSPSISLAEGLQRTALWWSAAMST